MRTLARLAAAVLLCASCGGAPDTAAAADALSSAKPSVRATVVLIHGWGSFPGVANEDYFYGVADLYRSLGARVIVPTLSPVNTIEERAAELQRQLDPIPGRLILLAHSQGGLDARYLVSRLGYAGRVDAVVTIATPHHGTQIADVAAGLVPSPVAVAVDDLLKPLHWSVDEMYEMSTSYMERRFNPAVPDAAGVTYWSWSGKATPFGLGWHEGTLHAALLPGWTVLKAFGQPNDGVIPEASAHWGRFRGQLTADHFTEVNQYLGLHRGFDAIEFYRSLLGEFHDQGW
jgi:triacylglycerol lipase